MIRYEDSETGAILYKKDPRDKKIESLEKKVEELSDQVKSLVELLQTTRSDNSTDTSKLPQI